jgi:hypothetical protein
MAEPTTRERVKELRGSDLFLTRSEIALKADTPRQHVFQIFKQEGLPTRHRIKKILYECPVCGTISAFKFCSSECKKKWQQIPIVCSRCGKLFIRSKHQFFINYRRCNGSLFCCKVCAGKSIAEQYGFGQYPKHSTTSKK